MKCAKCGEFLDGFYHILSWRNDEAFNPTLSWDMSEGLWCESCFEDFLTDCCDEAVACQECHKTEDYMYEDERDGEIIILCPDCAWKKGKVFLDNLSPEERWEGYEE